jgi:ATP-dependent Clp protease ATP-binding subunit ClpB
MSKSIIATEKAPAAIGPYVQATKLGDLVFTSGQIPLIPETMQLVTGDIKIQAEQVLRNLSAILEAAGASTATVMKTTCFLPDKAIDLIDEAAALIKTEINSMPTELDEITRRILQLEIEEQALKKEKDRGSIERLEKIQKELAELNGEKAVLKSRWEVERKEINKIKVLKEEIENLKKEKDELCSSLAELSQKEKASEYEVQRLNEELKVKEPKDESEDVDTDKLSQDLLSSLNLGDDNN